MTKLPTLPKTRTLTFAISALALCAVSAPVAVAQSDNESASALEEVIVTAQKREENIMDVPISISTLSGEELNNLLSSGDDIRFLRGRTPSLNVESSFGRIFPRFYIRGWGNTDFDYNASQPVSLVYDDVVQENPALKGFPIFDTQTIEVLRGPQGTLFGRNTPAGVIHVRSVRPSAEADGYVRLSATGDDRNFEGAIGGGFGEGNWSARLSAKYMKREDWVTNTFQNRGDLGGHRDQAIRAQLAYDGDNFSALFNVHARDLSGTARLFRANIIQRGSNGKLVPGFDRKSISIDGQNDQQLSQVGGVMRLEWLGDNLNFTSITGYESFDSWSVGDIDGGVGGVFEIGSSSPGFIPFSAETGDGVSDHKQFTQEFRLSSNEWGRFDWTAGFFYFNESVDIYTQNYSTNFGGGKVCYRGDVCNGEVFQWQDNEAWALFGSIDYDITDDLLLKVGLRYSDDQKDYVALRTLSPLSFLGVPPLGPIPVSADDSEISWDASVTRFFSDNTNMYVRVASGFRAPSIQGRILFGDTVSVAESETVISYELGVKTTFNDGRGRLGANLFYYKVDDVQLTAVGGMANFNQAINADNLVGQGFEIDGDFLFGENFRLGMGLSYNHTEIKDEDLAVAPCADLVGCSVVSPPSEDVPGAVLVNGNPFPQAPKWIFNLNARWGKQLNSGEIYVFADYFYRDKVNFFLYEAREFKGPALSELGLRFGYTWDDGRYDLALFGRNVTNEVVNVGAIDFNNLTGFVNEPRRWGLEFAVGFF